MTEHQPYELVVTPPAVRAIKSKLPEPVAAAGIEFLAGALIENPWRVGKPLRGDLAGIRSARRGTYRVLYRISERSREVVVLRIDPGGMPIGETEELFQSRRHRRGRHIPEPAAP